MGCCDDNIQLGSPGADGAAGISSYTYIAFADNVVAGTPDVVTNFSINTPDPTSEWMAIITSSTPIASPVASNFEDAWIKIVGADGVGSTGVNLKVNNVTVTGSPFTTLDFIGSGLSGITGTNAGSGEADIEIVTATLIKITRADILSAMALNGLIPGVTYWITDVGDGADDPSEESGIILRAIADNKLALDGVYVAKVVDRSVVIDLYNSHTNYVYDGITDFFVEAFNEVYRLDTVTGAANYPTHPSADGANWTFMTKDTALLYKLELHSCKYDLENDIIRVREDSRNNKLTNIGTTGSTGNEFIQQCFRWGLDSVINNNITCYQDIGGWSSGRMPDFSSWYQDYSSVRDLFYSNTIESGVIFRNTDFELINEVYECTFKSPITVGTTNIDFNTGTSGASTALTLIKSKFTDTIISNCHTTSITNGKFLRCSLNDVTGSTFTKDVFTDCTFDSISTTTFEKNIMLDSLIGILQVHSTIIGPSPIVGCTITNNTGSCDFAHLTNCIIVWNGFTYKAGIPNDWPYSTIRHAYNFKYAANTSFEFIEFGDSDWGVWGDGSAYGGAPLTGANAIFNGYSLCNFDFVQNTIDSHLEVALIRPDLITRPANTRANNSFTGNTFNGGYSSRLLNLIFTQATTFGFGYCTFGNNSGIINFIINPNAAAMAGAGAARTGSFSVATTGWSQWDINITIDGNSITTSPYNYVSAGTAAGANFDIEECTAGSDPSNKRITETESTAVGFLDMANTNIFAGGVLAIPIGMQWIGKYYLYNANYPTSTHNITNITGLAALSIYSSALQIVKEFRVLPNGAGTNTVVFTPTAIASATASTFSHTSVGAITLTTIADVVKIKRCSLPSNATLSSLEIVQTSIKA